MMSDRIYVKCFINIQNNNSLVSQFPEKTESLPETEEIVSEAGNFNFSDHEISDPNNTNNNTTIITTNIYSYTNDSKYNERNNHKDLLDKTANTEYEQCVLQIRKNISYPSILSSIDSISGKRIFEMLYNTLISVMVSDAKAYTIKGISYPAAHIKSIFDKLNGKDLLLAVNLFSQVSSKIRHPQKYMISLLYNVYFSSSAYMTSIDKHVSNQVDAFTDLKKIEPSDESDFISSADDLDDYILQVRSFIKEGLSDKEILALLKEADFDIERIKAAYKCFSPRKRTIFNITGWIISAIRNHYEYSSSAKILTNTAPMHNVSDYENLPSLEMELIEIAMNKAKQIEYKYPA